MIAALMGTRETGLWDFLLGERCVAQGERFTTHQKGEIGDPARYFGQNTYTFRSIKGFTLIISLRLSFLWDGDENSTIISQNRVFLISNPTLA